MKRLSQAGFKREFVKEAILPDWWDESCAEEPSLLQEIEVRVARFLGSKLSVVKDADIALAAPHYREAKLRKIRDVDPQRLGPAIHSALRIADAVVRNLQDNVRDKADVPPAEGLEWHHQITSSGGSVTLDAILNDLWFRGIPVVPVDLLPAPSFQGIACIAQNRPVILLGHKHDAPGRVAFLIAHEVGHIAVGDCEPGQPVVDEDEAVVDDSAIERKADLYATHMVVGQGSAPEVENDAAKNFRRLARRAADLELETGADAGYIIFAWAAKTGNYSMASMAVKALYRHVGARRKLQEYFFEHMDLGGASESDRELLRCVRGGSE